MSDTNDKPADSLTSTGITILGILLSVGVSVAMGLSNVDWWVRVLVGAAVTVSLVLAVKAGTRTGKGAVHRLARWTISQD